MEFFNYKTKLLPQKGRILVSEPHLPDPNFERSIVLICEHNEDGSIGFILNKPSNSMVSELLEGVNSFDLPVFIGGPVEQDTLHFIHRYGSLDGATEIGEGIYWGGDFERLLFLLESKQLLPEDIKLFLGYSGWAAGQLEEELAIDSWMISDRVDDELLFETDSSKMWRKALQSMGGRFSLYSNYPIDPRLN
jgi:putative transcriptional regulator